MMKKKSWKRVILEKPKGKKETKIGTFFLYIKKQIFEGRCRDYVLYSQISLKNTISKNFPLFCLFANQLLWRKKKHYPTLLLVQTLLLNQMSLSKK